MDQQPIDPIAGKAPALTPDPATTRATPVPASRGTTVAELIEREQATVPDWDPTLPRTSWADLQAHMDANPDRYVIEDPFEGGCVFWAETIPNWHRMIAGVNSPGFGCHPYVQVEFHMGTTSGVDWVTLARIPDRFLSGVVVVDDSVRIVSRRHLWTLDTHQFDLFVGEVNSSIVAYCMAKETTPPAGHWAEARPSLP